MNIESHEMRSGFPLLHFNFRHKGEGCNMLLYSDICMSQADFLAKYHSELMFWIMECFW